MVINAVLRVHFLRTAFLPRLFLTNLFLTNFFLLRMASTFSIVLALLLASLACQPPQASPPPTLDAIFEPNPNHQFAASNATVIIAAILQQNVCYTTDGTLPLFNNGTCSGGSTIALVGNAIPLNCGSDTGSNVVRTIRMEFDWPGSTNQVASANYVLDCSSAQNDSDGDGVLDGVDNCPSDPNANQADSNGNGIGDVCENIGAPDADGDGRADAQDNCLNVWNIDQADADNDGLGNVCDSAPLGATTLWVNDELTRALVDWKADVECGIRCTLPETTGDQGTLACNNGGIANWNFSIVNYTAVSVFTYVNCQYTGSATVHDYVTDPEFNNPNATTNEDYSLIVDGTITQQTDLNGYGGESGTLTVSGDFTGQVDAHTVLSARLPTSGHYSTGCTDDPINEEDCAPNGILVDYSAPDWSCKGGICPQPTTSLADADGDGVYDIYDNCPNNANPSQTDSDYDRLGNACDATNDTDSDNDGVANNLDNCPNNANANQADSDGDGIGDVCEILDGDSDGIADAIDNCPAISNTNQADTDNDGVGDACDVQQWYGIKQEDGGRCLYAQDNKDVRSSGSCDAANERQRWEFIPASNHRVQIKSKFNGECLAHEGRWILLFYAEWSVTKACNSSDTNQLWKIEDYSQAGLDPWHPVRIHNQNQNGCLYTNNLGDVYFTVFNCDLAGTEFYRKFGIYLNGDFSSPPLRQADF